MERRTSSARGPNGVPHRMYKSAPDVLRFLRQLMKIAWKKQSIPKVWRWAGGIFIPKERDSVEINQFRPISLNVEWKLFFSVRGWRLTSYLEKNRLIDTTVQKAGIPGFSGCLEHSSMIWHQIQLVRRERRDLHVVFLDQTMLSDQYHICYGGPLITSEFQVASCVNCGVCRCIASANVAIDSL